MALGRFEAQIISRGAQRCAIAAAAYRSGQRLLDERTGRTYDYVSRHGVRHSEIIVPPGTPPIAMERLWNDVEQAETRTDAQLARELLGSLPHELTDEQNIELAREFIREELTPHGIVAQLDLHGPDRRGDLRNVHAHIMTTLRPYRADGTFGPKTELRYMNDRAFLVNLRAAFEAHVNRALERANIRERVDLRKRETRESLIYGPEPKQGPFATELERCGTRTFAGDDRRAARRQRERAIREQSRRSTRGRVADRTRDGVAALRAQLERASKVLSPLIATFGETIAANISFEHPARDRWWEFRSTMTTERYKRDIQTPALRGWHVEQRERHIMAFRKGNTEILNEGGRVRVTGRMTAETAAAAIDVVKANGWKSVRIKRGGTPADKVALMLAALENGIEPVVDNQDKPLLTQVRTMHDRARQTRDLVERAAQRTDGGRAAPQRPDPTLARDEMGADIRAERSGAPAEVDVDERATDPGAERAAAGDSAGRGDEVRRAASEEQPPLDVATQIASDVLIEISRGRSTFTTFDLEKKLERFGSDDEQRQELLRAALAHPELRELGHDDRGNVRYTTNSVYATETRFIEDALAKAKRRLLIDDFTRDRVREEVLRKVPTITEQQKEQFHKLTEGYELAVLEGVAGGGKSFLMGLVREYYEHPDIGIGIDGSALAGVAADGLANESGIEDSRTNEQWKVYFESRPPLTDRGLVDDEFGMAGSADAYALLNKWKMVIFVGDVLQLQPISYGAPFRALLQRLPEENKARISQVRRQKEPWMARATELFFEGMPRQALELYEKNGRFKRAKTFDEAKAEIVASWAEYTKEHPEWKEPDHGALVLTYTRAAVLDLNERMREVLRERGEIANDDTEVTVDVGREKAETRKFATNERVRFTAPYSQLDEKGELVKGGFKIRNGTPAVVTGISGPSDNQTITLEIPSLKFTTSIQLKYFNSFDYGYAQTIHTAQGKTVDRAWALASAEKGVGMDLTYVEMSRHRFDCTLHYSDDQFKSTSQLYRVLTRFVPKDHSLDYSRDAAHMGIGIPNQGPTDVAIRAPYQIRSELLAIVRTASHLRDIASEEHAGQARRAYSSVREWYYAIDRQLRDLESRDIRSIAIMGTAETLSERMDLISTSVEKALTRAIDLERGTVLDRFADLRREAEKMREAIALQRAEAERTMAEPEIDLLPVPELAVKEELRRLEAAIDSAQPTREEQNRIHQLETDFRKGNRFAAGELAELREDIAMRIAAARGELESAKRRFAEPAVREAMQAAYQARLHERVDQHHRRDVAQRMLAEYRELESEIAAVELRLDQTDPANLTHDDIEQLSAEVSSRNRSRASKKPQEAVLER